MKRLLQLVALGGLIAGMSLGSQSCGEDAQLVARQVKDFIQNVQTGDGSTQGALVQGTAPDPSGGPTPSSNVGTATVLTGGSVPITINSDVPFGTIILLVGGAEDYYEINLPSPTGTAEILLTMGQDVPQDEFAAVYTVVNSAGLVGEYISTNVDVASVESGDIQVSVSWDAASDIDLAITGPDGERIDTANPSGESGATRNVSSNDGCEIDNINSENITYPLGRAASGLYTVTVQLVDGCGTIDTNWTATVNLDGSDEVQIERGTFGSVVDRPFGEASDSGGTFQEGAQYTFTFSFPPSGIDRPECPEGQRWDEELGECVGGDRVCGGGADGSMLGQSCEIDADCDGLYCNSDFICVPGCDPLCNNVECGGDFPVCVLDAASDMNLCGVGAVPVPLAGEYEACGTSGAPDGCQSPSRCLGLGGLEAVATPFCAPPCADNVCPASGETAAVCGLGEDGSTTATRCVLVCDPDDRTSCPSGMTCQALADGAICIWPLASK